MSRALPHERTIPAHPLGKPVDGRERYGMTHEMARAYRWLVENRSHDQWFLVSFRDARVDLRVSLHPIHAAITGLVERGWLTRGAAKGGWTEYRFVQPVMRFQEPRRG